MRIAITSRRRIHKNSPALDGLTSPGLGGLYIYNYISTCFLFLNGFMLGLSYSVGPVEDDG